MWIVLHKLHIFTKKNVFNKRPKLDICSAHLHMQTIWHEYKEMLKYYQKKKLVELQGCEYMLAVKFVSVLLYKCIFNDIKQPWKCQELHKCIISFILANSPSFWMRSPSSRRLTPSYANFQEIVAIITSYRYFEVETCKLFAFHAKLSHLF